MELDLVIKNTSEYTPNKSERNGLLGAFAQVRTLTSVALHAHPHMYTTQMRVKPSPQTLSPRSPRAPRLLVPAAAQVNLLIDRSTEFEFCFRDGATDEEVELTQFFFSFYDFDKATATVYQEVCRRCGSGRLLLSHPHPSESLVPSPRALQAC